MVNQVMGYTGHRGCTPVSIAAPGTPGSPAGWTHSCPAHQSIQANGTSPEEADRLANEIMERIARRKKLDNMAKYKDVNYENPEFAY